MKRMTRTAATWLLALVGVVAAAQSKFPEGPIKMDVLKP